MTPRFAIISQNTLEAFGLRALLMDIVPMVEVCVFASVEGMQREAAAGAPFVHYFVSSQVLVGQADFFLERARQTMVLTGRPVAGNPLFRRFRVLDTSQGEAELVRAILRLHERAHGTPQGYQYEVGQPPLNPPEGGLAFPLTRQKTFSPPLGGDGRGPEVGMGPRELSAREVEVLTLVARGLINKEIADRLCISLPTVVSHRKNICEKLHLRSVSALTIYAVTHGLVSAEEI